MSEPTDPVEDGDIPPYVVDRIRRSPPLDCYVLPGSTPVVAFGDVRRAHVATLGLNPSRIEFKQRGAELDGPVRRFETLRSLGVEHLQDAPDSVVFRVWYRCNQYFHGNPYSWFSRLEEVLNVLGSSYFADTACHLDLSQWATDPTWNGLPVEARERLISEDAGFLLTQLCSEQIALVLLNGRAVVNAFRSVLNGQLQTVGELTDRSVTTKLYVGTIGMTRAIGWSMNLQSSFGVTKELRAKLAQRVSEMAF
ncbi:MAG: hypothetical protein ACLQEG_17055 [Acidimicrobiales bacterium]